MPELVSTTVAVRAPATSANLGPGFDSLGLALSLYDDVACRVVAHATEVIVDGEGADQVTRDESHLVMRSIRAAFDLVGVAQPGLALRCVNKIPHGRGLGSSSAAIVAGIRIADALLGGSTIGVAQALDLATEIEGHPDNVAACLLGGLTIAWSEGGQVRAERLDVLVGLRAVAFVPGQRLATQAARRLLPSAVPHQDAAANSGRVALLVAALLMRDDLLLPATRDWLHQEYRRPAMPDSLALVDGLRESGHAAFVSGAGPTVLVLEGSVPPTRVPLRPADWTPMGWSCLELAIAARGTVAV